MALFLCLEDELLFLLLFFNDDLPLETSIEQKCLALDRSQRVLACTGRKIAKTIVIESKVLRLGLYHTHKGSGVTEAMVFTPRDAQLSPIVDRIFARIDRNPFLKEFVADRRRGEAPTLRFHSGLLWYFRIEGVSGTDQNMVGLRARFILGDEMAFGNQICHTSRIQTALPTCEWWYSGVPNGLRSSPFYRLDQTTEGKQWSRHKYPTFINPLYQNPDARKQLETAYGGKNTHGYRTQVLGEWGDELITSFPPGTMAVHNGPYFTAELTSAVENNKQAILRALGFPSIRGEQFAIGLDYGFSPDPTELLVAAQRGPNRWECVCRITMRQVALPIQMLVVRVLNEKILAGPLASFCTDKIELVQMLQTDDPVKEAAFIRSVPGGTTEALDTQGRTITQEKDGVESPVMVRVKEHLTDRLRAFMLNASLGLEGQKLWLGQDTPVIEELANTTERKTPSGYTVYYGPPDPDRSGVTLDHRTDALRFLADSIIRATSPVDEEDEGEFLLAMGWAGPAKDFTPAWSR